MIFKYEKIDLEINLVNNSVVTIQIESPILWRDFVYNLVNEVNGREGNILLHNNGKSANVSKSIEYIDNPLTIDYSNKKLITKLYQEAEEIANAEMIEKTGILHTCIINYFEQIAERLPYSVGFDDSLSLSGLLKYLNFSFSYDDQDLAERLITYIHLLHVVCGIQVFVTMHMKEYFTENEYDNILKTLAYEEISVINIETRGFQRNPLEKVVAVDADQCIIEY